MERKKTIYLLTGYLLFAVAMYTYDAFRVLSLLSLLILSSIFLSKYPKIKKQIYLSCLLFLVLIIPMLQFTFTLGGVSRFSTTSAFSEVKTVSIFQKIVLYPMIYFRNYLSFFSLDFLFNFGDWNGRHQIPGFGLFYRWQLLFLILGLIFIIRQKKSLLKYVVLGLVLVIPIPAALARPSPHSLRSLPLVLPLTICISLGLILFLKYFKKFRKIILLIVSIIAIYEFVIYLHFYYFHYPNVNALDWGAGYKELVAKSRRYKNQYDYLLVDTNLGLSAVYFNFYDNSLRPVYIDSRYTKLSNWTNKKALYISAYSEKNKNLHIVDQVYLPGPNRDKFAQFFKL